MDFTSLLLITVINGVIGNVFLYSSVLIMSKYLSILKTSDYDISIVPSENILSATSPEEYISFSKFKQIATELVGIDIDNLSISEAFDTLIKLQKEAISIMDEKEI